MTMDKVPHPLCFQMLLRQPKVVSLFESCYSVEIRQILTQMRRPYHTSYTLYLQCCHSNEAKHIDKEMAQSCKGHLEAKRICCWLLVSILFSPKSNMTLHKSCTEKLGIPATYSKRVVWGSDSRSAGSSSRGKHGQACREDAQGIEIKSRDEIGLLLETKTKGKQETMK